MKAIGVVGIAAGAAIFGGIVMAAIYEGVAIPRVKDETLQGTAELADLIIDDLNEQIAACQASTITQADSVLAVANGYTDSRDAIDAFFTRFDAVAGDADFLYAMLFQQDQAVSDGLAILTDDPDRDACFG